ncbi:MAG: hypothetical protein M3541_09415 [Acidobacteriota bacterium]|nr:hypothetical protein [Acidobacteriota bacterium]MDQ3418986.1 hypothetical protein [Acidobacteriota bacterium]
MRAYFSAEDPIGTRISYSHNRAPDSWRTIVGIVSDEKQEGLAKAVYPQVYESHRSSVLLHSPRPTCRLEEHSRLTR